ncbi:zinc ABC transporter substrate-binding protein [Oricola thermophila]|uniref:High-affinity zinc uptake system protein ZnuA n=1 Tax=Oricola thermophila TaxID=2742145 RepID=A0A6N1VEF0_9HYPH|nr:zinc ABC transporter substrate-binding protein [Oricola thermophila]QKV19320.1 zinc ABC transporter substrate-binding protein [Oricola thermophila]
MKFRQPLLLATVALPALTAAAQADVKVIASIKPVHSLVAAIMQGAGEPALIIEGASSPHTYSLKPSQAAALQDADIVFWIGEQMEAFLEKPINSIASETKSVALAHAHGLETLPFREGGAFEKHTHDDHDDDHDHEDEHAEADHDHAEDHDHDDGHDHGDEHEHEEDHAEDEHAHEHDHDHGEVDMHVWLDPVNAKAMAHEIAETLAEADPDNAELYEKNAAALSERVDALTTELQAELEPLHDTGYIVFHDAYQYFENRFGLKPAGSITVTPDVMPGADRLREIQGKVRELDATCVFAEPQFEPKLVSVVTEGTEARSGVLDPLGAELTPGPDLYFDVMRGMADAFTSCLSGDS